MTGAAFSTAIVSADFVDTGTVLVRSGTLALNGGGSADAGAFTVASGATLFFNQELFSFGAVAIGGRGRLFFGGGKQALNSGATLTVANWSISSSATLINETLSYAGAFSESLETTLTVAAGDTLNLTGASSLAGTVNGPGVIALSSATVSAPAFKHRAGGLIVGGAATLRDVGRVDQVGDVTIGDAGPAGATLAIDAGAVYRIDNRSDILEGSSRASRIRNGGLLIKSGGSGVSRVLVKTIDTGAIEAASGALDFTRAIMGGGTLAVDGGATLEAGRVGRRLRMNFHGADAVLALSKPAAFAATIRHFAAGDTIDLLKTAADAAALGPGDTLVISNGATTVATLQLAGDYSAATFNVASDGRGGTNITVTGAPAAAHFIAAMAGLGADGHGPAPAWTPSHADAWRPLLSGSRSHIA